LRERACLPPGDSNYSMRGLVLVNDGYDWEGD
jgi:hypothetical protein